MVGGWAVVYEGVCDGVPEGRAALMENIRGG